MRQEIVREPVQAARRQALEPRRGERLGRHLEGQLGENQHAQRPSRNVDAFPEGIGAEEDRRAGLAEAPQEEIARHVALHQQRPAPGELRPHGVGGAAQRAVAREETEDAAVGGVRQLDQHAGDGRVVPRFVITRLGKIGGNAEQALRGEIERRRQRFAHHHARRRQVEAQALLEKRELTRGGERGAREHHRLHPVEQVVLEQAREIERHRRERDVGRAPAAPLEPAHGGRPTRGRLERRGEGRRRRIEPAHHTAQLADELDAPLGGVVDRQAIGDGLDAVAQLAEGRQQVVEGDPQSGAPDRIAREVLHQA